MSGDQVPPPGSNEAIEQGCTCPRLDNAYGRGYLGGARSPKTGETMYVYVVNCPLHGAEVRRDQSEESGS